MTQSAILFHKVDFSYPRHTVLHTSSFSIQKGEFITLIGPNGGGKTTLLRLIMGFLVPHKGKVEVLGKCAVKGRKEIGYVPQMHRTDRDFPITLQELILMGRLSKRTFFGNWRKGDYKHCESLMEELQLLPHKDKIYGELSGGLAQRALLARALIADPPILLLDEPISNVDAASSDLFFATLQKIKGAKTILLVAHDLQTAIQYTDRFLCVQGTTTTMRPDEVCEHFALGLYHTPLLHLPMDHSLKGHTCP